MNTQKKILIVDDEKDLISLVSHHMKMAGFEVIYAMDGVTALDLCRKERPDLVILDLMLPKISGWDVCRYLREDKAAKGVPVILLSAMGEVEDKLKGFDAGADDYVTKPFSPRELSARIGVLLRNAAPQLSDTAVEYRGLRIDPVRRRVIGSGLSLNLNPTEFRLLHFMMTHRNRVYSRAQLLDKVWGDHVYVEERTVDVHIRRLRKALAQSGHEHLIETVRGSGYRFSA